MLLKSTTIIYSFHAHCVTFSRLICLLIASFACFHMKKKSISVFDMTLRYCSDDFCQKFEQSYQIDIFTLFPKLINVFGCTIFSRFIWYYKMAEVASLFVTF